MRLDQVLDMTLLQEMIDEGYVRQQRHPTAPLRIYNYTEMACLPRAGQASTTTWLWSGLDQMTKRFEIMRGVVGSTAYGMAHEFSDIDRLAIFVTPTIDLTLLTKPRESVDGHDPDFVAHEAGKYCRLALRCNPTVLELLWLPDYEKLTAAGQELIVIREAFLSQKYVRDAYFGYARGQFERIKARGDNSFSADTRKRTAKHARHLYRLLRMGLDLYSTGMMSIEQPPFWRDQFFTFGDEIAKGKLVYAEELLHIYDRRFDSVTPFLPEKPDYEAVIEWLTALRKVYWNGHE